MPDTPAGLAEVCLKEIPRWYRYKYLHPTAAVGHHHHPQFTHDSATTAINSNNNSNNGHHLVSLSLGEATSLGGLNPRDVRAPEMHRLGLLPPAPPTTPTISTTPALAPSPAATAPAMATHTAGGQLGLLGPGGPRAGGGSGSSSTSKKVIQKQVREAMAQFLLHSLVHENEGIKSKLQSYLPKLGR
ncbi:hypothetical protein N657DRAFT_63374 [Parathielavia appendiculata]|uniref:Uncharacterized protein n=1 Tax=Parathielavia appendiculata TaxID=2587402 RepID=A0AAN6Z8S4_9PEZI|nr:hypothetical protein N657DRAFT_63374 [Parathielavia appendiculata]